MKCVLAAACLCLCAAVFAQPADSYAGGADSLWERAVSLNSANSNWVPGSIYMHMQEVDKHGEPKDGSGHEVWTRLSLGEEGEVESEMVKVLDDGEDITEEERARREKEEAERDDDEDGGDRMVMESYSPFDPEHQGGVEARATGEEEAVDGRLCAVFEFTDERESDDEDEEGTVMGRVWLEIGTGIPLKAEYTTDPLPKRVKKMNTTVLYEYSGPEAWYAGSMNIRATGGILFIKKHFSMTMTFSDYWRLPEADSVSAGAGDEVLP